MILIIGGAYQGKLTFTKEKFSLNDTDIFTCCEDIIKIDSSKRALYKFDRLVLAMIKNKIDPVEFLTKNMELMREKIIISDDIFCGVVPMEAEARMWREKLGYCLAAVSANSQEVYRLFCGIAAKLK